MNMQRIGMKKKSKPPTHKHLYSPNIKHHLRNNTGTMSIKEDYFLIKVVVDK